VFVDSHCHLDFPDYRGKHTELLAAMAGARVTHALCISVTLEAFPDVLALAEGHDNLYATVGVHPDSRDGREPTVDELVTLARHPRVVGIGETGLDYYRLTGDTDWQRARFRTHIRAARAARKPLVVHTRSAAADTLRIMEEEDAAEAGGVMHCFTETWEVAEAAMRMGFLISFSGIVTFRNAAQLKEVAARVPLESMLIETDSPYLAPVPHRGRVNQPAWVTEVAAEVARLQGRTVESVAAATSANFFRLFKIDSDGHAASDARP
jgi:TatD DNase family protein